MKNNNSVTDDDDFDDEADDDIGTMMMAMMMSSLSASIPSSMKSSGVQQLCDQHSSDGQITRLPNIVPASPLYYAPYNGPPAQVQQAIKSIVLTIFYNNIVHDSWNSQLSVALLIGVLAFTAITDQRDLSECG